MMDKNARKVAGWKVEHAIWGERDEIVRENHPGLKPVDEKRKSG